MNIINWLPSLTTTGLLALALWLGRKLIATRLTKSVEHEFNEKIELIRAEFREKEELLKADLRAKEAEINTLRSGALTAMASRQVALDKRRLEATDQLWSAVIALGPAKSISSMMTAVKFDAAAEMAVKNPKVREMFTIMSTGTDLTKLDAGNAAKARPFVSQMAWALFSAYQIIALQAVIKLKILSSGIDAKDLLDKGTIANLVKTALPDQTEYIDKWGDAGYHYLLDVLEIRLLDEMRNMLAGVEADKASVEHAAKILKLSNELSAKK